MIRSKLSSLFGARLYTKPKKLDRSSVPTISTTKDKMSAMAKDDDEPKKAADTHTPNRPSSSKMIALARQIAEQTDKLETYMKEHDLSMPSFDTDAAADFPKLPPDVLKSREDIIFATKELGMLAQGPRESLRWGVWSFLDVLSLQCIAHYGIAKLWPINTTITLTELQTKTALDPVNLARFLRQAMTNHIFHEPSPGVIAHTAASRLLAEDDDLLAWIGFNTEDIFPAAAHVLQALAQYPEATEPTRTGFCFAFGTADTESMFDSFGRDPARARRMGRAMACHTGGEGYEVSHLDNLAAAGGFDLAVVDARGGTFVDVGGSHGFVCVHLARRYRRIKFVVQDLPKTVESAPSLVCEDKEDEQVAARITFQAHDFFTEQPVRGADVYFLRWIMHNHSTPYAIQILKNLVPALKPGARVIINDHCLREPKQGQGQEKPWDESVIRKMDLVMLALLNAQERTEAEFRALFEAADRGFVFKGVTRPEGSRMSIIEAEWNPGQANNEDEEQDGGGPGRNGINGAGVLPK